MSTNPSIPEMVTTTDYTVAPLTIDTAIERLLAHRRVSCTDKTIAAYRHRLRIWQRWRERLDYSPFIRDITLDEFRAFMLYLTDEHAPYQDAGQSRPAKRMAPSSIDGIYRSLQIFWNFLDAEDALTDLQTRFFRNKRIPRPKVPEEPRPTYGNEALEQILAACARARDPEEQARNRAMLLMLYDTGARISEVCGVEEKHVDLIERTARVYGKGRKWRFVFWTKRTATALAAYLTLRRGGMGGALFRSCGNDPTTAAITNEGFRGVVRRLAKRAGVPLQPGAPLHAFRHGYAHRALDKGMDGLHLQQLLGHASILTTMRYVRENPGGLRRIYRKTFDEAERRRGPRMRMRARRKTRSERKRGEIGGSA